MATVIKSDEGAATEIASSLTEAQANYISFILNAIAPTAPVPASGEHDGLSDEIARALSAWNDLITADAKRIVSIAVEFSTRDSMTANSLFE